MAVHRSASFACLPLFAIFASLTTLADAQLSMVLVVHRHGARTRLSKDSKSLTESQSTLTPKGMRQLSEVGRQVRERYLQSPECSTTNTCLKGQWANYSHSSWYVTSSATDRTLTSAQSFLVGALPPNLAALSASSVLPLGAGGGFQPVPIYSTPSDNDWVLRAYADEKCPAFLGNLRAFYSSADFAAKVEETKALLTSVNTALSAQYTLEDIFNIFDAQNVQRDYGSGTSEGGAIIPLLDNTTYAQVVEAADWLEWNRYGNSSQAENLCGGGLLADIVKRVENGARPLLQVPSPVSSGPTFVEYSAHYPTMLCLLSAINVNPNPPSSPDPNRFLHQIPAYGALIAIEVSTVEQRLRVQLRFQNGPGAPYVAIQLFCSRSQTDTSCDFDDFKAMTAASLLPTAADWCTACKNTTMQACLAAQVPVLKNYIEDLKHAGYDEDEDEDEEGVPKWSLAGGIIGATLLGMLVGSVATILMRRRQFVSLYAPHANVSV